MPFKLIFSDTEAPTSGGETKLAGPNQIADSVKAYDAELERTHQYLSYVADERVLLLLELVERDPNEDDRNARIAKMFGSDYTAKAVASSARRGREVRRSRVTE